MSIVGQKLGGNIFDFFGVDGIHQQAPHSSLESRLEYFNGIMGYTKSGKAMTTAQHEKWLIKHNFYGMSVSQLEQWAQSIGLGSVFSTSSNRVSHVPRQTRTSMQKILDDLKAHH